MRLTEAIAAQRKRDTDARAFIDAHGVTDYQGQVDLYRFTRYLKEEGLWSVAAAWPCGSSWQGVNSGSTTVGVLGDSPRITDNALLVNGPTWSDRSINSATSASMDTRYLMPIGPVTTVMLLNITATPPATGRYQYLIGTASASTVLCAGNTQGVAAYLNLGIGYWDVITSVPTVHGIGFVCVGTSVPGVNPGTVYANVNGTGYSKATTAWELFGDGFASALESRVGMDNGNWTGSLRLMLHLDVALGASALAALVNKVNDIFA